MSKQTPVLLSVGQFTNHGEDVDDLLSPADLGAIAVKQCLEQVPGEDLKTAIDTVAVCRLFSDSTPNYSTPAGGSNNLPRSISKRVGLNPQTAIYASVGGDSPQRLINEQCERIYNNVSSAGLVIGVEVVRTTKRAARMNVQLDWKEDLEGSLDDQGMGSLGLTKYEMKHGIGVPIQTYSLFEHALRHEHGRTTEEHQRQIAELFAPFSQVAAGNPYAQFQKARSVDELSTASGGNYRLTDIYTKYMVAQDAVDQAGAVLVVAERLADELNISQEDRVYLHGYSSLSDVPIIERPELNRSRPMQLAGERALSSAGCNIKDIDYFDIYSCFPSAVFCAQQSLGIEDIEPGKLTLTGGLPFFGGPGNSYSVHAIIEMVKLLRKEPEAYGLVLANGGYMSKVAVGIYSAKRPAKWQPIDSSDLQKTIDEAESPRIVENMNGQGTISNFTVVYSKDEPKFGYILGETDSGERFLATAEKGDTDSLTGLLSEEPIGRTVVVKNTGGKNYFHFNPVR